MGKRFKVGDHVTWNSEAGHVTGKIIEVYTKDIDYKAVPMAVCTENLIRID